MTKVQTRFKTSPMRLSITCGKHRKTVLKLSLFIDCDETLSPATLLEIGKLSIDSWTQNFIFYAKISFVDFSLYRKLPPDIRTKI